MTRKALLVNVNLQVRVIIDENKVDPETEALDEIVADKVRDRLKEEGTSFIGENIEDYNDDVENPFNPDFDE